MRSTIGLIFGLCFALSLFGNACTKESSEASEAHKSDAVDIAQNTEQDHEGHDHSDEPGGAGEAEEAYRAVIQEIRETQRSTRDQGKLVATFEKLLTGFIAQYPGTDQAADARLNLGQMYAQLGRSQDAIDILYELIDGGTASNEAIGMAHFILGEAYKTSDQFDKAEREYRKVVEEYSFIGPQAVEMAKANLKDLETLKQLAIGSKPIPFEVRGSDGEMISIEKYKGKVVLLDFWATWCGPCRVEMPNVVNVYKKNRDKGFEIIGVSLDRNRSAFEKYVKENGMDWPQFFDGKYWQNEIAMKYKVRSIPATFLIDRQGIIRYRSLRGRELEAAVTKLLKEPS